MNLVFMSLTAAAEAKAKAAGDIEGKEMKFTDPASQPVYMAPTPLFHVTANNCLLQPCTLVGGKLCSPQMGSRSCPQTLERGVTILLALCASELMHPDWETRYEHGCKVWAVAAATRPCRKD